MTPTKVALNLMCLFLGGLAPVVNLTRSASLSVISARVGGSVTLQCSPKNHNAEWFYWYKQTAGNKLQLVSSYYEFNGGRLYNEFKDSRFKLESDKQKNNLTISDLRMADSATYYCASEDSRNLEFEEGTVVNIEGSGTNVRALVRQPATSFSVSCTLNSNSCDGEHNFSWFRNSEESHPGIIYTHRARTEEREMKIKTQACIYNLPEKSGAHPDYCAVALCGHILFGNVNNSKNESESTLLVYFLSGGLAFNIILVVFMVFLMKKGNILQCSANSQERVSAAPPPHPEDIQTADDLHYTALSEFKVSGSKSRRDSCKSHCVYSAVMQ
ncbi:uncharacterized protein LOC117505413 [Thalassophryne amazonica]|uniref:uncharacterized protein LOC117505413 n=1 Tax=Thalassophryne amazonica TaxID=390379 RepID=UPI001471D9DE|nr:uncharacterized protein LOC117505413 [Thalassophryne amazonica]